MKDQRTDQPLPATENSKNVAAAVHLSTFSKYVFPFGNFLAPLVLWTINKEKPFVYEHGRQALNFQLSILVYIICIGLGCLPFIIVSAVDFISIMDALDGHGHEFSINGADTLAGYFILILVAAALLFGIFIFELYAVIAATIKASKGEHYKYPLTIPFIKRAKGTLTENQQKTPPDEHSS
ncbi:MAG: DUF4870 domain-containing protein [Marinirhabdus sp.]